MYYENVYSLIQDPIELPILDPYQRWVPTPQNPYPMNFVQAASPDNQVIVNYGGKSYTQGLSTVTGPIMFPYRERNCNPINGWERKHTRFAGCNRNPAIMYPTTHSIPGPYLQSYIALPRRMYPY